MKVKAEFALRQAIVPDDAPGIVAVANAYDSEPLTEQEFVRLHESWAAGDPRQRLVAHDRDGRIVGVTHCRRRRCMTEGLYFLNVYVAREASGQGIGRALVGQSEEFARETGGRRVMAFVPEADRRNRTFAESSGYRHLRTLFESVLDVGRVHEELIHHTVESVATRHSVTFESLAELGDTAENRRRLYDVVHECDEDEPTAQEVGLISFEDYKRQVLSAPWFRPQGAFVALVGGEWAGVHTIGPLDGSPSADMNTDFTGVRRPFRGKRIALALKMLGVRYARSLGRSRILTHNESTNAAMLAVNDKLGFERLPGWLFMDKRL